MKFVTGTPAVGFVNDEGAYFADQSSDKSVPSITARSRRWTIHIYYYIIPFLYKIGVYVTLLLLIGSLFFGAIVPIEVKIIKQF